MLDKFKKAKNHPAVQFGLPFLVFMVGGSFMLSYFTQVRYDKYDRRRRMLDKQEVLNLEADERLQDMRREFKSLINETKKSEGEWEQNRIKRPWE
ncbi:hypothetical protein MP638_006606 [Amoeboaphelidium occidentale]|nr:hypothetical protein MP638_006606 [Amoeboaphelidium occidentale]